jgi:hypothetical protein
METSKLLTRENHLTDELHGITYKMHKGLKLEYTEVFYLDYDVDKNTGLVNRNKTSKHCTKSQADRTVKVLKNTRHVAKVTS